MIKLEDKVRVLTPDATWIFGNLKDDTGTNDGTALNRLYHSDYANFFEKMFADSGIVANDLLDNETNGYQLVDALRTVTANNDTVFIADAGDWVDAGAAGCGPSLFGGTVTVTTTHYNRYKIVGKTLIWQLSFDITTTGGPTGLLLSYPAFMASDYDLVNATHVQLGAFGSSVILCAISGGTGGAGARQVGISLVGGGAFGNSTVNVSIVTELYDNS